VSGRLEVFVNNAGVSHAGPALQMSLVDWERVITPEGLGG
jgi:NAD(P)-dependent dehydrogenase (short-subunit alcohol dehydrogenase family)